MGKREKCGESSASGYTRGLNASTRALLALLLELPLPLPLPLLELELSAPDAPLLPAVAPSAPSTPPAPAAAEVAAADEAATSSEASRTTLTALLISRSTSASRMAWRPLPSSRTTCAAWQGSAGQQFETWYENTKGMVGMYEA